MFISEPSLLDREQAMALKGALEMWQKEGGEPLQLARFQVDYKVRSFFCFFPLHRALSLLFVKYRRSPGPDLV
jgi:hypothetical protein